MGVVGWMRVALETMGLEPEGASGSILGGSGGRNLRAQVTLMALSTMFVHINGRQWPKGRVSNK